MVINIDDFNTAYNDLFAFHNFRVLNKINTNKDETRRQLVHDDYMRNYHNLKIIMTIMDFVEKDNDEKYYAEEIFVISRAMFERVINMGVLSKRLYEGSTASEDLEIYEGFNVLEIESIYKHLTDLGYTLFDNVVDKNKFENIQNDNIQNFYKKFPLFNKKNKSNGWTKQSLIERVKKIDKEGGNISGVDNYFELLYIAFYRMACKVSHPSNLGFMSFYEKVVSETDGGKTLETQVIPRKEKIIEGGRYAIIMYLNSLYFLGSVLEDKQIIDFYKEKISHYNQIMNLYKISNLI